MGIEDRDWYRNERKEARRVAREAQEIKPMAAPEGQKQSRKVTLLDVAAVLLIACGVLWYFG